MADSADFDLRCHPDDGRLQLEAWRKNCAAPIALDVTARAPTDASASGMLVVLSWNVWIGHGRLLELTSRRRNGDFIDQGATPDAELVVLAQEVYRSDSAIPLDATKYAGRHPAIKAGHQREEIVETAQALGMNLRYAPSMRNAGLQSDRGNAILSTLPLEAAYAIELPFVIQRRVAVAATIRLAGESVCVVSAHLDPSQRIVVGTRTLRGCHSVPIVHCCRLLLPWLASKTGMSSQPLPCFRRSPFHRGPQ